MKPKIIIANPIKSDKEMLKLEGSYIDQKYYKNNIINYDCDLYCLTNGHKQLIFKYRRNVIPDNISNLAVECFKAVSKVKKENRGAASGPISRKKLPNYVGNLHKKTKFRTYYYTKSNNKLSKRQVCNYAKSNIVGYYDYPKNHPNVNHGNPCKPTQFLVKYPMKWKKSLPVIQLIDKLYKKHCNHLYKKQKKNTEKIKKFIIPKTVFSTMTVNYSWRTAIHQDKHNIENKEGITAQIVCDDPKNPNKYDGCYLGFPQIGYCVDVKQGDLLLMDNKSGWHGNTEFVQIKKPVGDKKDIANDWHYSRLSIICYLREGIVKHGS